MIILKELLRDVNNVGIAGHVHPDGDCVGSCLGLYLYIKEAYPQINVKLYLEEVPPEYHFMKCCDEADNMCDVPGYDLFIALDCGDTGRIGVARECFMNSSFRACVDHHISNEGYGDINYIVPDASSTSELIYEMITADGGTISREIAECLYTGIVQDTGVFRYSCTSPRTMEIAGDLMGKNINFTEIIDHTFFDKTYVQNRIMGHALEKSCLHNDGAIVSSYITLQEMKSYNAVRSDLDGIVSQLRNTSGVELSIFLYELDDHSYKVSLRSGKSVDVARLAGSFGGGGHVRAAGCCISGEPEDIINMIIEKI